MGDELWAAMVGNEMTSRQDSRRPRFSSYSLRLSPLAPSHLLQYRVATDVWLRGEQPWQVLQRVRNVWCCEMGLLCYGACPFFDKRKLGRVCLVLQQLVAEAAWLSAGWLDDSHEYGSNLLHTVGLGRNAGDHSQ